MKTKIVILFTAMLLLSGVTAANAQPGRRGARIAPPTDGMKDYYKDYFDIGVAVNNMNVTDSAQIALIKREFNSITAENAMKPQPTEPRKGVYNWEEADRIANFCRENGLKLRGHTLIWHSQIGRWMYMDEKGQLLSKEELFANMKSHINAVVSRYKDVIYCWDVVNEAMADEQRYPFSSPYRDSPLFQIAGDEFIAKAFEYAHEADPNAILIYNDYNTIDPAKCERIYNMVKKMKDAGVPIHGIGMQGHYNIYGPTEEKLDNALNKYKTLVDIIHVTELDIRVNVDQGGSLQFHRRDTANVAAWEQTLQNDQYQMLFRVFRKHKDVIKSVTFWNVSDKDSWLGESNSPLLFDKNYQPKPVYNLVKHFDVTKDYPEIKEDFVPSYFNQPGQEYPMVNSQGYARFRVDAPKARSVIVSLGLGGTGGTVLHKGADGKWWGTTSGPMDEGFHYYHLTVDGGVFNDPGTGNYFGSCRWESGIEIPAHDQGFYADKNVPHGKLEDILFWSESGKCLRPAVVYTPPTYDASKKQKYPVLYLQHGWGENETSWSLQGRAGIIMDNMIAEGRIQPFIVVMTYGLTNDFKFGTIGRFDAKDFEPVLIDELIPFIDSHYRTKANRENRAMAGLSMGGMETRLITLRRPDVFGYWGLLSGGTYLPADVDGKNPLGIFIGCGSKENAAGVLKAGESLKEAGYNAKAYVSEGTAHEFLTWRRCLYEMAPMLFVK